MFQKCHRITSKKLVFNDCLVLYYFHILRLLEYKASKEPAAYHPPAYPFLGVFFVSLNRWTANI